MSIGDAYPALLSYARRFALADAAWEPADLVQAAFVKVAGKLDPTRSIGEQVVYLRQAIGQVAIDQHRRAVVRERVTGGAATAVSSVASVALTNVMLAAVLAELLADGEGRIVLAYAVGYGVAEQAAALGRPVGSVKTSMYRARQRLRATHDADERGEELDA